MIRLLTNVLATQIKSIGNRTGLIRVGTTALNCMLSGGGLQKRMDAAGWPPNLPSTQRVKSRYASGGQPWVWTGKTRDALTKSTLRPMVGRQGNLFVEFGANRLRVYPWSLSGPRGNKEIESRGKLLRALGSLEFGYGKLSKNWGTSKKKGYVAHSRFEDVHTRKVVKTGLFGFGAKKTVHIHSKAEPKLKTMKNGKQKVVGVKKAKGSWGQARAGRPWYSEPMTQAELDAVEKPVLDEMLKILGDNK